MYAVNLGAIENLSFEEAKQDRIQFSIGEWILDGHQSDFEAFLGTLANSCWPDTDQKIFTRPQGADFKRELKFVSRTDRNGNQRIGAPLVDGSIVFYRQSRQHGSGEFSEWVSYRGTAFVTLNPTRALAHQPVNREIIDYERGRRTALPNYHVSTLANAGQREYLRDERPINPLDDNVLIDRNWRMMGKHPHWQNFSSEYLYRTLELLITLINQAARDCDVVVPISQAEEIAGAPEQPQAVSIGHVPNFNLREVESYWEVQSENPIADTYRLEPYLRSLGTDGQFRVYDNVVSDRQSDGNAPVISAKLVTGLWVKIYPKTTKRIRIELTHDFSEHRAVSSSHTFSDLAAMYRVILAASEDATQEVNTLLTSLRSIVEDGQPQYSPYELLEQIYSATNNPQARSYLIQSIIENGGYRHRTGMRAELSAANRLTNRHVLYRTRPSSPTYSLRAEYQQARRILAATTDQV